MCDKHGLTMPINQVIKSEPCVTSLDSSFLSIRVLGPNSHASPAGTHLTHPAGYSGWAAMCDWQVLGLSSHAWPAGTHLVYQSGYQDWAVIYDQLGLILPFNQGIMTEQSWLACRGSPGPSIRAEQPCGTSRDSPGPSLRLLGLSNYVWRTGLPMSLDLGIRAEEPCVTNRDFCCKVRVGYSLNQLNLNGGFNHMKSIWNIGT